MLHRVWVVTFTRPIVTDKAAAENVLGGRAVQTKSASLVAGARAACSSVTLVSTHKWRWLVRLSFIGTAFVRDVVHLESPSRKVVMR